MQLLFLWDHKFHLSLIMCNDYPDSQITFHDAYQHPTCEPGHYLLYLYKLNRRYY